MSDIEALTDAELLAQLAEYGEDVSSLKLPLKRNKRPILIKKLNHLKVRVKAQEEANRPKVTPATRRGANLKVTPTQPEKKRSPQLVDGTLRTLRRRTGVDKDEQLPSPPKHTPRARASEMFELSSLDEDIDDRLDPRTSRSAIGNHVSKEEFNNSFGSERSVPTPSPARSRLYPDLRKFNSSSNDRYDFESSDSDLEGSTFEVENKSVNTSFPSLHHGREPVHNSFLSSSYGSSSFSDSEASPGRSRYPYRRSYGGTHRVQQYKSAISEYLPHVLVAIALCFFITLSLVYITNHKDFFMSWLRTPSNMGDNDELLKCPDDIPDEGCYSTAEVERALQYVEETFHQLSTKKGEVMCEKVKAGEEILKASNLKSKILRASHARTNAMRLYDCCLDLILANPHWNLRPLRADGSEATTVAEVISLESKVASMGFWCRLMRSFTTVLYGLFLFISLVGCAVLISFYVKYRLKKQEQQQREVYSMVEKIIDILQEHHERTKGEDSDETPYLAVQHVRDQLLPPSQRYKQQPIWDKAVEFISANESRIRLETRMIHGEEFDVWHWLQPPVHNGKMWQGQAFGEASDNNSSNQRIYSPTQCLKIRNMFDSNGESEEGWEQNVIDAILEKCEGIDYIVHAFVDTASQEGCVYLKCTSLEAAGRARQALHGWWFDGRLVTVRHLKTDHYHKRWPEARTATKPLKPSTNQMKSLSHPFHRSPLEVT